MKDIKIIHYITEIYYLNAYFILNFKILLRIKKNELKI